MKKILIIDDDEQIREMLEVFLNNAGYKTTTAINGKEGELLYQSEGADLVIMDLYMPEQTGLETLVKLKSYFSDVKVIAMSGGYRESYRSDYKGAEDITAIAKKFGAVKTLTKPMKLSLLLKTVKEIVG